MRLTFALYNPASKNNNQPIFGVHIRLLQSQHATCKSQYAEVEKYSSGDTIVISISIRHGAAESIGLYCTCYLCDHAIAPTVELHTMAILQKIIILESQKSSEDNFVDLKANHQYLRCKQGCGPSPGSTAK